MAVTEAESNLKTVPLASLRNRPYALLAEMDRRLQATNLEAGLTAAADSWVGLGFRMGEQWYLAPQREVREVIVPPESTRVPGARAWLRGVANVRGNLLPLVDLGLLLGFKPPAIQRGSRYMVLNSDEVPGGFLVDAVSGYRRFLPQDQRHELVAGQPDDVKPYLLGGFVREGESWLVFSLMKLIRAEVFQNASG